MSQGAGDGELEGGEEQELYEHHRIVCDPGQTLLRLDKFLFDRLANTSRNRIQVAARAGNVRVNDRPAKPSQKVKPGDIISIVLPYPQREVELKPEDIPLRVLFEDDHVVVIDKPAGLVVHPGHGNWTGTLVNALLFHFGRLPAVPGAEVPRPGLVHRLDKDTSGVMVVGKNEEALTHLARQFFERTSDRRYQALVWGDFTEDEGVVEAHIGRSPKDRTVQYVFPGGEQGKPAVTRWRVVERFRYVTLVECKLETGRTHQIRVHMQWAGHPLFNDAAYGGDRVLKGTTFTKYRQFVENCFTLLPRQALHARTLEFDHPVTGARMRFESPLPPDMEAVLARWRTYTAARPMEEGGDGLTA
ncbi:MAG: RluA family pseudouridine synthase [Flavobacteriales bacterium]|nr:Ribosomal large subunit pseudouridine synthase D [Flavobacteriales bacterium]MCC6576311.1 RluA family pseudouridine synthase [Flavobacteriales bacterium]NUQ15254.1 RluA family pseudouridine synthase [Flavobacteriales bacterium]